MKVCKKKRRAKNEHAYKMQKLNEIVDRLDEKKIEVAFDESDDPDSVGILDCEIDGCYSLSIEIYKTQIDVVINDEVVHSVEVEKVLAKRFLKALQRRFKKPTPRDILRNLLEG